MPEKLIPVFLGEADVRGAWGGRGSAKTRSFAKMSAVKALMFSAEGREGYIVCARQFQNSLEESSFTEVELAIKDEFWLLAQFDIGKNYIRTRDGRIDYSFIGLERNLQSIKSKARILLCWIDEAEAVKESAYIYLLPTLREDGVELWVTWNPESEESATNLRFRGEAAANDPRYKIVPINYRDNKKFPAVLDRTRLRDLRDRPNDYDWIWEGAYRSTGGILFKRDWFQWYEPQARPSRLNIYIASDYAGAPDAANPNSKPDHTEHGVWGLSPTGELYALDWWYGVEDPATWIDEWLALVGRWKPRTAFEEKGVILRSLDSAITKRMRETQTFVHREALASAGSKAERALGFAARASAKTIYLPKGRPWAVRLLNQLCSFTGEDGRLDDGVDVCSLMGRGLDLMLNAQKPPEAKRKELPKFGTAEWMALGDAPARQRFPDYNR